MLIVSAIKAVLLGAVRGPGIAGAEYGTLGPRMERRNHCPQPHTGCRSSWSEKVGKDQMIAAQAAQFLGTLTGWRLLGCPVTQFPPPQSSASDRGQDTDQKLRWCLLQTHLQGPSGTGCSLGGNRKDAMRGGLSRFTVPQSFLCLPAALLARVMAELLAITWVGARARPLPRAALCAPQALGALGAGAAGHTCSSHSLPEADFKVVKVSDTWLFPHVQAIASHKRVVFCGSERTCLARVTCPMSEWWLVTWCPAQRLNTALPASKGKATFTPDKPGLEEAPPVLPPCVCHSPGDAEGLQVDRVIVTRAQPRLRRSHPMVTAHLPSPRGLWGRECSSHPISGCFYPFSCPSKTHSSATTLAPGTKARPSRGHLLLRPGGPTSPCWGPGSKCLGLPEASPRKQPGLPVDEKTSPARSQRGVWPSGGSLPPGWRLAGVGAEQPGWGPARSRGGQDTCGGRAGPWNSGTFSSDSAFSNLPAKKHPAVVLNHPERGVRIRSDETSAQRRSSTCAHGKGLLQGPDSGQPRGRRPPGPRVGAGLRCGGTADFDALRLRTACTAKWNAGTRTLSTEGRLRKHSLHDTLSVKRAQLGPQRLDAMSESEEQLPGFQTREQIPIMPQDLHGQWAARKSQTCTRFPSRLQLPEQQQGQAMPRSWAGGLAQCVHEQSRDATPGLVVAPVQSPPSPPQRLLPNALWCPLGIQRTGAPEHRGARSSSCARKQLLISSVNERTFVPSEGLRTHPSTHRPFPSHTLLPWRLLERPSLLLAPPLLQSGDRVPCTLSVGESKLLGGHRQAALHGHLRVFQTDVGISDVALASGKAPQREGGSRRGRRAQHVQSNLNKGDPSCPFLRKTVEGQPPRMVQPRLMFSGREERAVWRQEGWMGSNPGETDFVTQPAGKMSGARLGLYITAMTVIHEEPGLACPASKGGGDLARIRVAPLLPAQLWAERGCSAPWAPACLHVVTVQSRRGQAGALGAFIRRKGRRDGRGGGTPRLEGRKRSGGKRRARRRVPRAVTPEQLRGSPRISSGGTYSVLSKGSEGRVSVWRVNHVCLWVLRFVCPPVQGGVDSFPEPCSQHPGQLAPLHQRPVTALRLQRRRKLPSSWEDFSEAKAFIHDGAANELWLQGTFQPLTLHRGQGSRGARPCADAAMPRCSAPQGPGQLQPGRVWKGPCQPGEASLTTLTRMAKLCSLSSVRTQKEAVFTQSHLCSVKCWPACENPEQDEEPCLSPPHAPATPSSSRFSADPLAGCARGRPPRTRTALEGRVLTRPRLQGSSIPVTPSARRSRSTQRSPRPQEAPGVCVGPCRLCQAGSTGLFNKSFLLGHLTALMQAGRPLHLVALPSGTRNVWDEGGQVKPPITWRSDFSWQVQPLMGNAALCPPSQVRQRGCGDRGGAVGTVGHPCLHPHPTSSPHPALFCPVNVVGTVGPRVCLPGRDMDSDSSVTAVSRRRGQKRLWARIVQCDLRRWPGCLVCTRTRARFPKHGPQTVAQIYFHTLFGSESKQHPQGALLTGLDPLPDLRRFPPSSAFTPPLVPAGAEAGLDLAGFPPGVSPTVFLRPLSFLQTGNWIRGLTRFRGDLCLPMSSQCGGHTGVCSPLSHGAVATPSVRKSPINLSSQGCSLPRPDTSSALRGGVLLPPSLTSRWVMKQTAGQQDRRAAGQQDRRTAGQQGSRTAGQLDRRTAGPQGSRAAGPQDSWTAGPQDRRTSGSQDSWTAGQQDSRTAGQLDRRTDGLQAVGRRTAGPAGPPDSRVAGPQDSWTTGQQGSRTAGPQGSRTAGQQGSRTAGQLDRRTSGSQDSWTAGQQDRRTAGPQDHRTAGPQDSRIAGPQDSWTAGQLDCRTVGPQDRRTAGPQDSRVAGPQDSWTTGQQDSRPAGQQDRRTAGPQDSWTAGQQSSRTTGQLTADSRTAGQQGSRTAGQLDHRAAGQQDSRPAGQQDRRTAGQQDRRTAGPQGSRTAGQQGSRTAGQLDRRTAGWTAGQQDCRTVGPQDRRTGGQQDRRTAGPQDSRTAGQQGSRTAGQLDRRTAGPQDSRTAGQQDSRTAGPVLRAAHPFPKQGCPFSFDEDASQGPEVDALMISACGRSPRCAEGWAVSCPCLGYLGPVPGGPASERIAGSFPRVYGAGSGRGGGTRKGLPKKRKFSATLCEDIAGGGPGGLLGGQVQRSPLAFPSYPGSRGAHSFVQVRQPHADRPPASPRASRGGCAGCWLCLALGAEGSEHLQSPPWPSAPVTSPWGSETHAAGFLSLEVRGRSRDLQLPTPSAPTLPRSRALAPPAPSCCHGETQVTTRHHICLTMGRRGESRALREEGAGVSSHEFRFDSAQRPSPAEGVHTGRTRGGAGRQEPPLTGPAGSVGSSPDDSLEHEVTRAKRAVSQLPVNPPGARLRCSSLTLPKPPAGACCALGQVLTAPLTGQTPEAARCGRRSGRSTPTVKTAPRERCKEQSGEARGPDALGALCATRVCSCMTLEVRPLSLVVQVEGSEPAVLLGEALLLLTKPQARRGHKGRSGTSLTWWCSQPPSGVSPRRPITEVV
ncbi:Ice nucleation protein [Camelus dromedarius]|uniref:Ice nucleation protein n=1 Tax=Camelus dromedarius TaxID=9838 RepID=A0A5N4D6Y9_CAMDR|nr:Ice nucleation protein [Camelus dromedarius]